MIIASASDYFQFGFGILIAFIGPLVGLVISIAALSRRGLNVKCGVSAVLLFLALFIAVGAMALQQSGGISTRPAYYAYVTAGVINVLSALLGIFGLREMRRRRKWQRGARRAISAVTTNIIMLGTIATYFYLRLNPWILDNFLQGY